MTEKRTPAGAAVLRPDVTAAITEATLDELAERGYGALAMEAVARRAGVGKSALYRRWPTKRDMVVDALAAFGVPRAIDVDTGTLAGDVRVVIDAVVTWLTEPRFARVLPEVSAAAVRDPELAEALIAAVGEPRRRVSAAPLHRAIERGELPPDADIDLALDLLAAPLYWRLSVRHVPLDPDYPERVATAVLRVLGAASVAPS